jgi:DNA-binding CsgD family transcriptional regulator
MEGSLNVSAAKPVAAAINALGADEFPERLLDVIQTMSDADASMILHYWPDRTPAVVVDRLDPKERPYLYGDYLAGVYRLSPFYRASAALNAPQLVRLKDIAPEGFNQSEYYKSYFARIGMSDLAGMLLPVPGNGVVHLSFARKQGRPGFSRAMLGDLTESIPVFAALAQRHWKSSARRAGESAGKSPLDSLRADFDLTKREAEIAEAILAGHSSKSAARSLAIASETVKVHRKHLYAKLGIASQGELFSLFLARLSR